MKLTIDTEEKTLIIKDKTLFGDLIKQLDSMFPNKEWMEYTIFDKESSEQWGNYTLEPVKPLDIIMI